MTYSAAAKIAANTAFLGVLDGAETEAKIRLKNVVGVILATIPLDDPCGTVNGTTGALTITAPEAVNVSVTGAAVTAELCDGDNVVHKTMPCIAGTAPVAGYCVLKVTQLYVGGTVALVSLVIS